MPLSLGNFYAGVNVDESFIQPVAVAAQNRIAGIHPRVRFPLRDGYIDFRAGESDDEFRILQTEYISEEPSGNVNGMADGLAADPHARRRTKLFQGVQAGVTVGDEQVVLRAVGRAEINQLVDVVLHARRAEHGVGHQRGPHAADGQAVGLGDAIDVIGRLPSAARTHVLHDDGRISRNMLAQNVDHSARSQIRRSRRRPAENDGDRFVLIERRLRPGGITVVQAQHRN